MRSKRWIMLVLLALFLLFAGAVSLTSFPAKIDGILALPDTIDRVNEVEFRYVDDYQVAVVPGQRLIISMEAEVNFDSMLYLLNAQNKIIDSD